MDRAEITSKSCHPRTVASNHDRDLAIARPSLASGPAIVGLCAECHSPRTTGAGSIPDHPSAIRFQGTTLTWSRCYIESETKLDCVTCHNPHRNAETSPHGTSRGACNAIPRGPAGNNASRRGGGSTLDVPGSTGAGCIDVPHAKARDHDGPHGFHRPLIRVHRGPAPQAKKRS